MIEAYIGLPGSGKTYTLTARAIEEAQRGRPVFANYPINYPGCHIYGPDQLLKLPAGVVVMDEAHLYMPARGSMRLPMSWLMEMSQTRKNGWTLLWSTQHERRVDAVLRDVTNWMWLCHTRKLPWDSRERPPRFFVSRLYEPENFRRPAGFQYPVVRRFKEGVATSYDTFGKIAIASHLEQGDFYAKREAS